MPKVINLATSVVVNVSDRYSLPVFAQVSLMDKFCYLILFEGSPISLCPCLCTYCYLHFWGFLVESVSDSFIKPLLFHLFSSDR